MFLKTAFVLGLVNLAAVSAACGADGGGLAAEAGSTGAESLPRPLVAASAWARVEPEDDPFSDMRPAEATCDESGLRVEDTTAGSGFEIDTRLCDYATVQQAALAAASKGDSLTVRIWHEALTAPEPATGFLAVAIGPQVVWSREVSIPADPALLVDDVELPLDIEYGEPVSFHVHNHGFNSWTIIDLEVE